MPRPAKHPVPVARSAIMADRSAPGPGRRGAVRAYDVHIEGLLSQAMIGYLGWPSRTESGHSQVRVSAGSKDLADFLRSCAASGLVVDRVTRLRP